MNAKCGELKQEIVRLYENKQKCLKEISEIKKREEQAISRAIKYIDETIGKLIKQYSNDCSHPLFIIAEVSRAGSSILFYFIDGGSVKSYDYFSKKVKRVGKRGIKDVHRIIRRGYVDKIYINNETTEPLIFYKRLLEILEDAKETCYKTDVTLQLCLGEVLDNREISYITNLERRNKSLKIPDRKLNLPILLIIED